MHPSRSSSSSSLTLPGPASSRGQQQSETRRFLKRAAYYVPFTQWITEYSWTAFSADFLAGLTVASVLVPQSISYAASLAKLNPLAGLFCASLPGIFYALLGTSRQLNVGPTAAVSLLLGQAVSDIHMQFPDLNVDKLKVNVTTVVGLQAGLIAFFLGFFRLGFIDVVLSRALLRGFISALATVILIEQLIPMLGLAALERVQHPKSTMDKVFFLIRNANESHRMTVIISFTTLVILFCTRALRKRVKRLERVPDVLLAVIIATILSAKYRWNEQGVDILGLVSVKKDAAFFKNPFIMSNINHLRDTTSTAILIATVGFLDSIAAAKQNASRFGHSISPNRELVALGVSNLAIAFVPGTLPAFGSTTRSRINGDMGGKTQIASLVCSAIVLVTTFWLMPYLEHLPKCALAPVICTIAYALLEDTPGDVAYYWKMGSYSDLALMALTFLFSIIWDMESGIIASFVCSLLLVVNRSSKIKMDVLSRVTGTDKFVKVLSNEDGEEEEAKGVLIVRIKDSLDFANTSQLKERLRRIELYGAERQHPSEAPIREQANVIILHMADVERCDASAIAVFEELIKEHHDKGIKLFVTHLSHQPRVMFTKSGLMELLGPERVRENVSEVMNEVDRTGSRTGSFINSPMTPRSASEASSSTSLSHM